MDTLTTRGRAIRVLGTALALALLLTGTLWGQDDDFPFGPFRMYAGSNPPNDPAPDTRIEGVDTTGSLIGLDEANTGIRRAEIEGQQARYEADPTLLRQVADAYAQRHPAAPTLVEVRIVIRWYEIKAGRPTGHSTDETVAQWQTS